MGVACRLVVADFTIVEVGAISTLGVGVVTALEVGVVSATVGKPVR